MLSLKGFTTVAAVKTASGGLATVYVPAGFQPATRITRRRGSTSESGLKSTEVLQCHIVVIGGIKAFASCAESAARACQTALEAGVVDLIRRATSQVALVRTAGAADVSTTQNVTFGLRVASSETEVPRADERFTL